jgi:hypothetical protein
VYRGFQRRVRIKKEFAAIFETIEEKLLSGPRSARVCAASGSAEVQMSFLEVNLRESASPIPLPAGPAVCG